MNRPACVKCNVFMRPLKNGIYALQMVGRYPYQLWGADIWICPICSHTNIHGYSEAPIADRSQSVMYEMILNNCYSIIPQERIVLILVYDNEIDQANYLDLEPDPMEWLREYCEKKVENFKNIG